MLAEKTFAVLIDSDNVSPKYLEYILNEVSNYGMVTYKRIYGDWTSSSSASWKKILLDNAITPIQQYSYTKGKNATDSAMIIDAMDILYSNSVSGFCIVSSDSDFTKLAVRLRESGMMVIGMGELKTPKPFTAACSLFKYLNFVAGDDEEAVVDAITAENGNASVKKKFFVSDSVTSFEVIVRSIVNIINENGKEENGMNIAELGNRIVKRHPDFDIRNFGYTQLSKFLAAIDVLSLYAKGNTVIVKLKDGDKGKDEIQNEILNFVAENGGRGVNFGLINQWLRNNYPNFNVRKYGYTKLLKFVSSIDGIRVISDDSNNSIKTVELVK